MAKTGAHIRQRWPIAVFGIFALTGFLFVAASVSADGGDLRPAGGDTGSLVQERKDRVDGRREDARQLRSDIDKLSARGSDTELKELRDRVAEVEEPTGLTAMKGPGIRVTLTDTPNREAFPDEDPNVLLVHEQDIQGFVNALWAGGAEAVTLQGQRLISTTGIKCVGSTVVLDGVPYSPPYVIEAIGNPTAMNASILTTPETVTYGEYSVKYNLGLKVETRESITAEAYAGAVGLRYASANS